MRNIHHSPNLVNVVYITDDNYALPTLVSIASAILSKKAKTFLNISVILDKVSDENVAKFHGLGVQTIAVDNLLTDFKWGYVSTSALLKFRLPYIFPELDKILYIDGDTLILDDLADFFSIDLADKYAAVIRCSIAMKEKMHIRLKLQRYFNSGVMLLNLSKMRNEKLPEKMELIRKTRDDLRFMDQDVLNIAFNDNIFLVSSKYNVLPEKFKIFHYNNLASLLYFMWFKIWIFVFPPSILHMTGGPGAKPWREKTKFFRLWYRYERKMHKMLAEMK